MVTDLDKKAESKIINLNKKALEFYKQDKVIESLLLYHKAENLLIVNDSVRLKLLTYNNLACYHLKENNLEISGDYLDMCCKLEPVDSHTCYFLIGALLNLSALKSKQKKSKEALSHSLKAYELLQKHPNETLLVLSYYSIGFEYQNIGDDLIAENYLHDGKIFSKKIFGSEHELTKAFENLYKASNKKVPKNINEICILGDFPNLRRKTVAYKPRDKSLKDENIIKIDTTPWIGDSWKLQESSYTPTVYKKPTIRSKFSYLSKQDVAKSFNGFKVYEKLGLSPSKLEASNIH